MEERRRPGQPGAGDPRRQRPAQRPDAQRRAPAEGASRPRPEGAQRARQPGEAPRSAQRSTNPRRRPQKKESILKKYNINIKQFPIPGWIFLPLMVLAIVASTPLAKKLFGSKEGSAAIGWGRILVTAVLMVLCVAALASQSYNPFIYFRF